MISSTASRTTFVAVNAIKNAAAIASPAKSKSVVPGAVKASLVSGALSLKTPFVSTPTTFAQRRTYASKSPVTFLPEDADAITPPDQSGYLQDLSSSKYDTYASRNSAYLLVGAYGFVQAAAVQNIAQNLIVSMAASADVVALAKTEVDMDSIPEGKTQVVKWRGKPVFVRHRTAEDIAEANSVNVSSLRHAETDAERVKTPEWLVMLGVCTHLGCVPIGDAGEYGGWFCPCHGSHYDISGRIRKGPAPLNLEIPPYQIVGNKIVIG
ncbi:ubiquinol--cytochrome-c reductase catalytic subunit rip1 [Blyttiomyces sp. JEL0837]|nr:ubiquinol--cytochrome-c reductase catalytic subunit rip1 [Blyttiomyces sp. JEL0837]